MSEFINVSLCVSDIPKDRIRQAANGKKYINITVAARREADQFGNTHTVFMSQLKEERDVKRTKVYVGNGKAVNFTSAITPAVVAQAPMSGVDDLPF